MNHSSYTPMPMDYLMRIRHETFPLTVTDEGDVNNAAVLLAAGFIAASIPARHLDQAGTLVQPPAVIRSITLLGHLELEKLEQRPPPP